jgi:hypothetical protein
MNDYINREDALKAMQDARIMVMGMRAGKTILSEYAYQCKLQYLKTLIDIPRADVKVVKHARQELVRTAPNGTRITRCTYCKTERRNAGKSAYCRDCGARFDLNDELDGQMSYLDLEGNEI